MIQQTVLGLFFVLLSTTSLANTADPCYVADYRVSSIRSNLDGTSEIEVVNLNSANQLSTKAERYVLHSNSIGEKEMIENARASFSTPTHRITLFFSYSLDGKFCNFVSGLKVFNY